MGNKLVLLGAGGHCKSVLDAALRSNRFNKIVITDPVAPVGTMVLNCRVVGPDALLPSLYLEGFTQAFITVGSIQNYAIREKLVKLATEIGFVFPVITDPSAQVSQYAVIGNGTFVGKNAIVNAGTIIGEHCIINTGAIVEHDCTIGNYSHVSVGAILCGSVSLKKGVFIGAGSTVIQNVAIGKNTVIGAHSAVLMNVGDNMKANGIVKHLVYQK